MVRESSGNLGAPCVHLHRSLPTEPVAEYRPRQPQKTTLYQVVSGHWPNLRSNWEDFWEAREAHSAVSLQRLSRLILTVVCWNGVSQDFGVVNVAWPWSPSRSTGTPSCGAGAL